MENPGIAEIAAQELAELIAEAAAHGSAVPVVDVREDDEWIAGHIAGARHVALGVVPDHLDAFGATDAVEPTYVVCRSGARSLRAAEFAAAHGKNVVNIADGMVGWAAAGHDVATGS